jgi:hypothetical protein
MGAGNDSVTMRNLRLPGTVSVNGQRGANTLVINNVHVALSLNILNSASLSTTTTIAHTTVGRDLMMEPGYGGENIALRSVNVRRNTKIVTGNGSDTLTIDDSIFHGATQIYTGRGRGADVVQIEAHGARVGLPTSFDGPVRIFLGASDDTLQVGLAGQTGNRAVFANTVLFDGGSGRDTLLNSRGNTYRSTLVIRNFESTTAAPTVRSTSPRSGAMGVALNKKITVGFSKAMAPLTITAATFTLKRGNTPIAGTVSYAGTTATFSPTGNLAPNTTFTATITGGASGVKDLAGNRLASNKVWSFTTGAQIAQAPIDLERAGTFAVMATASITSTGPTRINGDVGLNPGSSQGIPPAQVNGTIHVDDQAIKNAQIDLLAAYNDAVSRSVTSVSLPGNMGGLTFTPGLYTNSSSVLIQGAGPGNNVTLDARGNSNAIFIFKMGSTLTTGPGAQVILAGGAKAGNIFWQVGSSATLNTTTIFKGNILAAVTITVNKGSVVVGRLLGGSTSGGSVTINASTITVPAA